MNWDQVQGSWKEMKGKAQEKWGELTDDDWAKAAGQREQVVGTLQRKYGKTREVIEREVDDWLKKG